MYTMTHKQKALQLCQFPDGRHCGVVVRPDGSHRYVKNLGWLLRHASEVSWVHVHKPVIDIGGYNAVLTAGTRDGQVYAILFADKSILEDWLDRPSLSHVRPIWHCTKADY